MKKTMLMIAIIGFVGIYFISSKEASAVGIIGGSDGPTAIFLTSKQPLNTYIIIGLVGLLCIVIGLVLTKK
ncbi:MAG: sodium ion-translocating decarboxylase subunit beta [Clostridiales bacterium]|nr:sodium ion-translocating decarboxylase subunit beta [Clostridiales bacterium]